MKQVVLVSTLMLVAVLVAAPLCAQVAANAQDKGLPGTWLVKVQGEPFLDFLSLVTVNSDGTWEWILPTTGMDGALNADSRVVCTGPWHRTGARTYHMTLYCLESQAIDTSSGRYMFDVTLSKDGKRLVDPAFHWEWYVGRLPDGEPDEYGDLSVEGTLLPDAPKP